MLLWWLYSLSIWLHWWAQVTQNEEDLTDILSTFNFDRKMLSALEKAVHVHHFMSGGFNCRDGRQLMSDGYECIISNVGLGTDMMTEIMECWVIGYSFIFWLRWVPFLIKVRLAWKRLMTTGKTHSERTKISDWLHIKAKEVNDMEN